MKKIILLFLLLLSCVYIKAEENKTAKKNLRNNKVMYAGCTPPLAQTDLDISDVRARIIAGGDMWWDFVNPKYEVPINSGKTSIYAGALWIGGVDASGNIKTACQTYRQTGEDFFSGPIDPATISITTANCQAYDKLWKLNRSDVAAFVSSGTTTNQDIITYPGNSPYTSGGSLAPFFDANGDGTYNYLDGDYPFFNLGTGAPDCCDQLHGDQCVWWVINDVGDVHSETGSPQSLGIEIRCQAYAFDISHAETATSTFYQYTMINKSSNTLDSCYFGQWVDPDLGDATDDYVGCDAMKGVGYCYNADSLDGTAAGYGLNPPAIGADILHGPLADAFDAVDNNHNGIVDEPNEDITMTKFLKLNNDQSPVGNPQIYTEYYNFLRGICRDGSAISYGGVGYGGTTPCNYMFPGTTDPAFPVNWTEGSSLQSPGDRRFLMSAGAFTMLPGAVNCITIGVVWARADSGGQVASVYKMLAEDSVLQILFDSCFASFATGINTATIGNITGITPNPFSDKTIIHFNNPTGESYSFKLYDMNGTLVQSASAIKNNFIIVEKGNLKSGVYIFKLSPDKTEKGSVGKLMVK